MPRPAGRRVNRADAIIVIAGAVLLLLATVAIGVNATPPATPFDLRVSTVAIDLANAGDAFGSQASFDASYDFEVAARNLTSVWLNVTINHAGSGQERMAATLVAPDGSRYEAEATATAGATQSSLAIVAPLATLPAAARVEGGSQQGAQQAADERLSEAGLGRWMLTIHFDAAPLPANQAAVRWTAEGVAFAMTVEQVITGAAR